MPLTSFVNSLASKAQSTIQHHIPQTQRPPSPDSAAQPSANEAAAAGGHKSHTLGALQHQFRTLQQQYAATSPAQKIVTTGKGIAIDFDSVSRDAKSQSKELYTWGQTEADDLRDVTDRLAYLNFVHGSIAAEVSVKLDAGRASFKALRDAEQALAPRRTGRATLNAQLSKVEHEQGRGADKKIAELKEQIRKAEADDAPEEREIELLKRKAVRESEQAKWAALREYGEKLVLLSQAASQMIPALPAVPPTAEKSYTGAETTASARVALQRAMDSYTPGLIQLPEMGKGTDLSRHDTRSFGQSHASELSSLDSAAASGPGIPVTPLAETKVLPAVPDNNNASSEHPIDPASLNTSPAPIPPSTSPMASNTMASPPPAPDSDSPKPPSDNTPTVAETGVPVTSTSGPSSGSLLRHETAEEEKKRLEREEVERARKAMADEKKEDVDDLPPYQEM